MNKILRDQLISILDEESNIDMVIDQKLYPKPDWAVSQIVRSSGLVEDICEHGVGHPNAAYLRIHDPDGELGLGIHGCDQCCFDEKLKKKLEETINESNR